MGNTTKLKVLLRVHSGGYRNLAQCFVDTGKTAAEKKAMTEQEWYDHVERVKSAWELASISIEWRELGNHGI